MYINHKQKVKETNGKNNHVFYKLNFIGTECRPQSGKISESELEWGTGF